VPNQWLFISTYCRVSQSGLFLSYRKCADQLVLCVDEESGLATEAGTTGESFFDEAGAISPALKPIVELLTQVQRSRQATDLAVSALAQADVIKPWQINLKSEQGERAISGLHRIDEAALGALPADVFLKLRPALPIAYAQILSVGQLGLFEHLARLRSQPAPLSLVALPETIDGFFELPNDDVIRFR
jgi:hypothetical protein